MFDIYEAITNRIIEELEKGQIPWQKPWVSAGSCVSYATGKPYSLLNQILLGRAGEYATFQQIQKAGGRVRKGEKSRMVVFWKWIEQKDEETEEVKKIPFLRYFNVFHLDDTEGIKAKHTKELPNIAEPSAEADRIITDYLNRSGVKLSHEEGNQAYYQPSTDRIVLPLREQFTSTAEYYSTAFHELTHSTGHSSRLDRLTKLAAFGSEEYSKEELVAEIGAATLNNAAGLETSASFRNSAAYVQNWLTALQNDKRLIVSASGKAEKAVDLILNK